MKELQNITLLGLDCVDIDRLIQASEICKKNFKFGAVKLLTSIPSSHPNIVKIDPVNSIKAYNEFMINKVNDYVDTDIVLIIQYDGFILNPQAWTDEYLKYDYIGAPWYEYEGNIDNGKYIVGNGGFSLRSKKLLNILQKNKYDVGNEPEDTFICVDLRKELEKQGIKFAPAELAKQFSLESNEKDGVVWTNQFGFHGLKWTDISNWTKQHPEYKLVNELDSWALGLKQKLGQ